MSGQVATGLVLIVAGVWLLLQTTAGDLPRRLVSWGQAQPPAGGSVVDPGVAGHSGLDPDHGQSGGGPGGGGGGSW